jgi:glycosyltransferase involved in cell wall biosynthesis
VTGPLVSVVTPTWQRRGVLLERCIPSVAAQTYAPLEHLIVSDGPDPFLAGRMLQIMADHPHLRYLELPEHNPVADWGVAARLGGLEAAKGEIVAYLDDDNAYRPDHLRLLVEALEGGVDFAYSRMERHWGGGAVDEVGVAPPQYGRIDTSLIAHRAGLTATAGTWSNHPGMEDPHAPDWDLVSRWVAAGATWAHVPVVTVDYY